LTYINFSRANCRNCYKCLRYCPVKAIKIKNEQAEINSEKCIACGLCLTVCPQNARNIKSDLSKVKNALSENRKVIASIAPSFPGAFDFDDAGQVVGALKSLGFSAVEETAVGAELVSDFYGNYMTNNERKNIITTCCPAVNYLIERYFPGLTGYMIPAVSPMIAHGKVLKHTYGMDSFTVFIGPCLAKKYESKDFQHDTAIDAVLTFEELNNWIRDENLDFENIKPIPFDRSSDKRGKLYPVLGSVIKSVSGNKSSYKEISVSGLEECMELFESLENEEIENIFIEANACRGGCINGPGFHRNLGSIYRRQRKVLDYINSTEYVDSNEGAKAPIGINLTKAFFDRRITPKQYREKEIIKVLNSMGKYEPSDEMNCGVCGYNTCREKAGAILDGMAETNMCLDYMRNQAESMANIIFENTPNIIIVLDSNLKIKEFNTAAECSFNISLREAKDKPISILLEDTVFYKVLMDKKSIYRRKQEYASCGRTFVQNILYIDKQNMILLIMEDITLEEENKEELITSYF
jgi:iron only hydrogenase large subunit-like protein